MTNSMRTPATITTGLDHYNRLVSQGLHVPVVCISLIDGDGWLTTSSSGLPPPDPMLVAWAFLKTATDSGHAVVVGDARADPRAAGIPAVRDGPVAAFLGMPIVAADGCVVGTVSAMAKQPRRWRPRDVDFLRSIRGRILAERGEAPSARRTPEPAALGRHGVPGPEIGPSELGGGAP